MLSIAIDNGVQSAMQTCREVQIEKQLEILRLGLRGLKADRQKFAHIPEIKDKIDMVIKSIEKSMNLVDEKHISEKVDIEKYIDVEQRRDDETPLEFELKKKLNKLYTDPKSIEQDAEIKLLTKQLQIEISRKHFNASIHMLKDVFDESKIDGLTLDSNSLLVYAMLSQSLDRLSKLDIISEIGLPFLTKMVKSEVPPSGSFSEHVATEISKKVGAEAAKKIGEIVDAPLQNLKQAVEYSEKMSVLIIPGSEVKTPFMAYYVAVNDPELISPPVVDEPHNFLQAIEQISKADGVLEKVGALGNFYRAVTSGSAEGCLDNSEDMFDSMNQGLQCELLRQRFTILEHVDSALSKFKVKDLPLDWQEFQGDLESVLKKKSDIDDEFKALNSKYNNFKQVFDNQKKKYDKAKQELNIAMKNAATSEYVALIMQKEKDFNKKMQSAHKRLALKNNEARDEAILNLKKEAYKQKFGAFKEATTFDDTIVKYFKKHPDKDLTVKIDSTRQDFNSKLQIISQRENEKIKEKLDEEYKNPMNIALETQGKLKELKLNCDNLRGEMAESSRGFYAEAQKFREKRDEFDAQINFALNDMNKLSTPENNQHLWQLKTLARWSADELAPLDHVVKLLSTVGDKIKADAIKYSDIFKAVVLIDGAPERKMKAEVARGEHANFAVKAQQGAANMLGGSLVEIKVGEQMGYLKVFSQNIASTMATEDKLENIRKALSESESENQRQRLAVRFEVLTHVPEPMPIESKRGLSKLFSRIAAFFKNLNPFVPQTRQTQLENGEIAKVEPIIAQGVRTSTRGVGDAVEKKQPPNERQDAVDRGPKKT